MLQDEPNNTATLPDPVSPSAHPPGVGRNRGYRTSHASSQTVLPAARVVARSSVPWDEQRTHPMEEPQETVQDETPSHTTQTGDKRSHSTRPFVDADGIPQEAAGAILTPADFAGLGLRFLPGADGPRSAAAPPLRPAAPHLRNTDAGQSVVAAAEAAAADTGNGLVWPSTTVPVPVVSNAPPSPRPNFARSSTDDSTITVLSGPRPSPPVKSHEWAALALPPMASDLVRSDPVSLTPTLARTSFAWSADAQPTVLTHAPTLTQHPSKTEEPSSGVQAVRPITPSTPTTPIPFPSRVPAALAAPRPSVQATNELVSETVSPHTPTPPVASHLTALATPNQKTHPLLLKLFRRLNYPHDHRPQLLDHNVPRANRMISVLVIC